MYYISLPLSPSVSLSFTLTVMISPERCDVDLVVFKVLQVECLNVKRGEGVVELKIYYI